MNRKERQQIDNAKYILTKMMLFIALFPLVNRQKLQLFPNLVLPPSPTPTGATPRVNRQERTETMRIVWESTGLCSSGHDSQILFRLKIKIFIQA